MVLLSWKSAVSALAAILLVLAWKLWLLVLRTLVSAAAITADRILRKWLNPEHRIQLGFACFPRTSIELVTHLDLHGKELAKCLPFLDKGSFGEIVPLTGVESEPDKNATSMSIRIVYALQDDNDEQQQQRETKDVFFKFQTGGHMPLWLQAVRWGMEGEIVREVDYYNLLSHVVPIQSPKVFFAKKSPIVNTVCIALQHYPLTKVQDSTQKPLLAGKGNDAPFYYVLPDHQIKTVRHTTLMLTEVAKMNGAFLHHKPSERHPAAAWIPAKQSLDFCSWVKTIGPLDLVEYHDVFDALYDYFRNKPVTLVHGDCRPGNMIFAIKNKADKVSETTPLDENEREQWNPDGVIFGDWEAVNVAPLLWDFTYSTIIGLPLNVSVEKTDALLVKFRDCLLDAVDDASNVDSLEDMKDQVMLLYIAMFFVFYAVGVQGYWDGQGNTVKDGLAWMVRLRGAFRRINTTRASALLRLDEGKIKTLQKKAVAWRLTQIENIFE